MLPAQTRQEIDHRTIKLVVGVSERFEYQLIKLQDSTANQTLVDAEADGYRMIRLVNDVIVLERQSASAAAARRSGI